MTRRQEMWSVYARGHRWYVVIVGLVTIPLTELWLGSLKLALPGSNQPLTFRSLAPAAIAALLVANRQKQMSGWEQAAARPARDASGWFLSGSLASGALTTFATQAFMNDIATAVTILRAYLISIALALISARLIGWRTAWVLPLGSYFPLTYLQIDSNGRSRWWNWPAQPANSVACWILAGVSLAIGIALVLLTPRRLEPLHGMLLTVGGSLRQQSRRRSTTVNEANSLSVVSRK
jgi:hypothetical protein